MKLNINEPVYIYQKDKGAIGLGKVVGLTSIGAYVEGTSPHDETKIPFKQWFPTTSTLLRLVKA